MTANSELGNVISRLGGLKNVSGRRRVMPEFLQDMDEQPDVSGLTPKLPNFANFSTPTPNKPESDLGGEITPQSYDIRANSVQNPQDQAQEPGFWSKVGGALANYVTPKGPKTLEEFKSKYEPQPQAEPNPINQPSQYQMLKEKYQPEQPNMRPEQFETPGRPESSPGIMGAIKDYLSPTKNAEMDVYNKDLSQNAQLLSQNKNPEEVRNSVNANFQQDLDKAMQNPGDFAVYGSADEVASDPRLQQEFQQYTGINYTPQVQAEVSKHEEAMKGVEDALSGLDTQLNEQAEGIKQRILNNQSTDADKYYIGLALLMPLIVGGIFGKEAGLGALGGSAKGIAESLGNRQKGIREDEASLLDINKQQAINQEKLANVGIEKAKLPMQIRKNLPDDPYAHLSNMDIIRDENGKVMGAEIKPGLVAKAKYLHSQKSLEDMTKAANELTAVKTYVDDVNSLTDDVINIVGQLKDPTIFYKGFVNAMGGKVPGALSKLTQDVEFEGRRQNAGTLLEEKLGFLANKYGMAQQLGQLDRAAQSHIKKIMDNPTSTLLTPRDALNQMLEVRKLVQNGLVNQAENAGFYSEYLKKGLQEKNQKLVGGLNQKEDDKYNEQLKKKLMQNETNYAQ